MLNFKRPVARCFKENVLNRENNEPFYKLYAIISSKFDH